MDYDAHPAQIELARLFSGVRMLGPPMSEKLVRLVAHLFTPEEADLAIHVPPYYPKPLERVARSARRNPAIIEPILDGMARKKVIYGGSKGYALLPLIPGMFEYLLMDGSDTEWHRKYAELLVDMWRDGYTRAYNTKVAPAIRNIPVSGAVDQRSRIVDTSLIEEMISRHDDFAVLNVCQCRQSMRFVGDDCKRAVPEDGCLVFGSFARGTQDRGDGRNIEAAEMRDIVAERWEKNLVFLTANISPESPNVICTCCDCCCHFLETVREWNGKVLLAPPRVLAEVNAELCNNCGKCARACNTGAHKIENKKHVYDRDKCLGCGLCVSACKEGAITMVLNPEYKEPAKGFVDLGFKLFPSVAASALTARIKR